MGYSIAAHCGDEIKKQKMYSFMLENYKEPKDLFNKKANCSCLTDNLSYDDFKFALGFDYNGGTIERHYIYCICGWMAIKVGKRKRVNNQRIPYYVYDGGGKTLLILVKDININTENYVRKQVRLRLLCQNWGVDVVDRLGFFRIEEKHRKAMETLIGRNVDEVDSIIKNELKRLNDLWEGKV